MAGVFRFCSWNIQVGLKRATVLEVVTHHPDFRDLDVLALQEASAHENGDDASAIARVLGKDYAAYQHVYHHVAARPQANALVWNMARVHFDAIDHHTLPSHTEVAVPRAERAVLNRFRRQPRVNLVGDGTWQGLRLRVCSAHLDVIGYRFKQRQFRAILEDLLGRPPVDLTLLAGDFNTFQFRGRPTWAQLKRDAAELDLVAVSDEIPWTQAVRALRLRQKLDEIFVASAFQFESRVWTLNAEGSDHLPVFAEIVLW
jgi:endonuclease/exonuclease/phosphatase family metal-dependent hydrolase